jgi:hypothetical protein
VARSSDHDDALLAELLKHPGFEVLKSRSEERATEEALRLADTMLHSNHPTNQRKIDEMRGFWRGVEWFIRETKRGARAFDKGAEEE